MQDYQNGLKIVDQVMVLKNLTQLGQNLVMQDPDSDEMLFWAGDNGYISTKKGSSYYSFKGAGRKISETGLSRTLGLSDAFEFISCSNASGTNIIISNNVDWPNGVEFTILRESGAGEITVTGDGVTILNPSNSNVEEYGVFSIKEVSENSFVIYQKTPNSLEISGKALKAIESISDLKSLNVSNFNDGDSISVLGYYTSGDGGGGDFVYNQSSSVDDNTGTVIAPNQGSGRWERVVNSLNWSVKWFGAKGDGSTNDTSAIDRAGLALSEAGGGVLIFPTARYNVSRRVTGSQAPSILLRTGISIDGRGSTIVQNDNASTMGTDPDTTARAIISSNVAVGDTTLNVVSSSSLAVGQTVGVRLGDNPWDSVETCCFYYAKITAIPSGTSITLDTPAPVAMVVADTETHNKKIIRFDSTNPLYENQFIRDINFDQGSGGGAVVESAIYLYYSRNISLNNIGARHPGAGVTMAYGFHNHLINLDVPESIAQGGQGSKGRGVNLWNCSRCLLENVRISKFQGAALFIESFCSGIIFRNLSLNNNWLAAEGTSRGTAAMAIINQGSEVALEGVTVTGKGSTQEFVNTGGTTAYVTYCDIDLATTDKIKGGIDLSRWTGGFIRFGSDDRIIYHSQISEKTITVSLSNNMAGVVPADSPPVGYLISAQYFCNDVTGLDGIYQTRSLTSALLTPNVSNASTDFFSGNYGTDYTFNTPEASGLAFYTNTVAAGAFITLRFRYAPVTSSSSLLTGSGTLVAGELRADSIKGKAGALSILGNIVTSLPTSSSGLPSGSLWNDSGTLKVV